MKKVNILIIVQNNGESAKDYAQRLELICNSFGDDSVRELNITFTTASNGRQTANIIYFTDK